MGRLIDADLLKGKMKDGKIVIDEDVLKCDTIHSQLVYLLEKVESFIDETIDDIPTAYNVEKVIEQLEQEETEWCDKYCEEKAKGNIDLYVDGFGEGLTRALWIVRNGGKE